MNSLLRSQLLDTGLLLLRIGVGSALLLAHGWPKLANYSDYVTQFPDPVGLGMALSFNLAIFAEVLCAIFIVIGFATRLSAIPILITMLVAFFVVHGNQTFSEKELSFMYAIPVLSLILTGGGKFSLDFHLPFLKKFY